MASLTCLPSTWISLIVSKAIELFCDKHSIYWWWLLSAELGATSMSHDWPITHQHRQLCLTSGKLSSLQKILLIWHFRTFTLNTLRRIHLNTFLDTTKSYWCRYYPALSNVRCGADILRWRREKELERRKLVALGILKEVIGINPFAKKNNRNVEFCFPAGSV